MNTICIIISTPFQLISALSIVESKKNSHVDLYIIGNFANYKEIELRLKKLGIFENIVSYHLNEYRACSNSNYRILKSLMRQISYLKFVELGKKVTVLKRKYDEVYFAAAVSAQELIFYFQKMSAPEFIIFDDGVMTYREVAWVNGEKEKIQFVKKLIYCLYGKPQFTYEVYSKELFNKMNPSIANVKTLDVISDKSRDYLIEVFEANKNESIKGKVIIIECKVDEYLSHEDELILEELYSKIIDYFGNDNVLFKRHPRDNRELNSNRNYLNSTIPFELWGCGNDLNDNILIAWDSTAVLTPKLFYGQEPMVILLYKIVNGKRNLSGRTNILYNEFWNIYEDKKKFFIPQNVDELLVGLAERMHI